MKRLRFTKVMMVLSAVSLVSPAWADLKDLELTLDAEQAGVSDLERIDKTGTLQPEIELLKKWLEEANKQISQEEEDRVRELLELIKAQKELIRQKTAAANTMHEAMTREAALQQAKAALQRTRKQLSETLAKKRALKQLAEQRKAAEEDTGEQQ